MSNDKKHIIFPEMPEQPDLANVPISLHQPSRYWCPSREILLVIIIPILVLGAVYTWSRYDSFEMDQVQDGLNRVVGQPDVFERIWGHLAGLKMTWQ